MYNASTNKASRKRHIMKCLKGEIVRITMKKSAKFRRATQVKKRKIIVCNSDIEEEIEERKVPISEANQSADSANTRL